MKVYATAKGQGVPQRRRHPRRGHAVSQNWDTQSLVVRHRDILEPRVSAPGAADPVVNVEGTVAP
jgi:hypothetical protein